MTDGQGAISITPLEEFSPSFAGDGRGIWLRIEANCTDCRRLTISGMRISDYVTAIHIPGQSLERAGGASNVSITNNIFERIGGRAPGSRPSTAVIRLVGSSRNLISGNTFLDIQNESHCELLHAIYLAHGSSDNVIHDNIFGNSCAIAIKVRDGSNRSLIVDNKFEDQSDPRVFQDWFCDPARRRRLGGCRTPEGECPSYGNTFWNNTIENSSRHTKYPFHIQVVKPKSPASHCPVDGRRVYGIGQ